MKRFVKIHIGSFKSNVFDIPDNIHVALYLSNFRLLDYLRFILLLTSFFDVQAKVKEIMELTISTFVLNFILILLGFVYLPYLLLDIRDNFR